MRSLILVLILLAACGDKKSSAPAPSPSPTPATAPTAPTAPPIADDEAPTATHIEQMFVQLDQEKQHRPTGTPTVETVLGALETAGIAFDEKKQVLGLSVGAKYCMRAGVNANGLNVVVCEYASPAEAKAGIDVITTRFAAMSKTRTFTIKGATTIQVMDRPDQPLTDVRRTIDAALATL